MYLGYRNYQLLFDLYGLAILLAVIVCLVVGAVLSVQRKFAPAIAMAALAAVLAAAQIYRGAMVTDRAWLAMLGAIESTIGSERELRVAELRSHWQARTMRAGDWYFLSAKWGVCHSLWQQDHCESHPSSQQGVGLAREALYQMATAARPER